MFEPLFTFSMPSVCAEGHSSMTSLWSAKILDRNMIKAGDLARREDRRVKGVKIGKT